MNEKNKVKSALKANVVEVAGKRFLRAGAHQFGGLWTRDFALSVPGLVAGGFQDVAQDQLELLFKSIRDDGLLPRGFDSASTTQRVLAYTVCPFLRLPSLKLKLPLKPEYTGEHGTRALDSNALSVIAAFEMSQEFVLRNKDVLLKISKYYVSQMQDGLIVQGKYEDWQDSATREGSTFFVNLCVWKAWDLVSKLDSDFREKAQKLRSNMLQVFLNKDGLFRTHKDLEMVTVDGLLLALDWNFLESKTASSLYEKMKLSFTLIGQSSLETYPNSWISYTTRFVGLKNYHDRMIWSWLIGKYLKVAKKQKDLQKVSEIENLMQVLIERDGTVYEIYNLDFKPFKNLLYRSEAPFSWGASCWLEGLEFRV